jgi:hypothetical protein
MNLPSFTDKELQAEDINTFIILSENEDETKDVTDVQSLNSN